MGRYLGSNSALIKRIRLGITVGMPMLSAKDLRVHTRSRRVGLGLDCERASIGVLWVSTTVPGKPHTLYLRWDVIAVTYL